jgi:uncharacterized protein (DUF4415 family)
MKPATTSKPFPRGPEEIPEAIARAPARVEDPENSYDPNDAQALEQFWKSGSVRLPGQRGVGQKPATVLLSVRYSPEVVACFRATGKGWQTRMNEVLEEWVAGRRE